MRVYRTRTSLPETLVFPVATIGNFDGVHLGHRRLVERLRAVAEPHAGTSVVITFDPHPMRVLRPELAPASICTRDEKLRRLEELGTDCVWEIPFDSELARWPAERFIETLLVRGLQVRHVVAGPDSRFGRGRTGDAAMLRRFGEQAGFVVESVEQLRLDGLPVSSSRIRELVSAEGDVCGAGRLLGRFFRLIGPVVHGQHRGRTIGFPTANVDPVTELLPAFGVYAAWATVDGSSERLCAVVNVGEKPTFGMLDPTVEAHLLDFKGDLYGRQLSLDFVGRIREEKRFSGIDALVARIRSDVALARRLLDCTGSA